MDLTVTDIHRMSVVLGYKNDGDGPVGWRNREMSLSVHRLIFIFCQRVA